MRDPTPEELQELQKLGMAPPSVAQQPVGPRNPTPAELQELGVPPSQPNWAQRNIVNPIGDYITAAPVHDPAGKPYPEAGFLSTGSTQKDVEAGAAFAVEGNPEYRANAIASRIQGAAVRKDERGNVFLDIPPETQQKLNLKPTYIMNQPGPSWQDLTDVVAGAGEILGIGKLIGPAKTTLGLGIRSGVVAGGVKAGEDIASQQLDTKREPNAGDWLETGLLGGIFGAAGGKLWQGLRSLFSVEKVTTRSGALTDEAKALLTKHGVDPNTLTPDAIRRLADILPRAANPAEAARLAKIQSEGVTATKGDISQSPKAQAAETRLVKGASPGRDMTPTETAMRSLKTETQPRELAESASTLVGRLTGKAPGVDETTKTVSVIRGQEFDRTQRTLKALKERDQATVKRLYERGMAEEASVDPGAVSSLSRQLQKIKEGTNVPQAHSIADEVAAEIKKAIAGGKTPITIEKMELIRKKISELGASTDPATRQVGGELRRAYGEWEKGLTADNFVKGSPEAVKSIMAGRVKRAEMGAKFDDDPLIAGMLKAERMADGKYKLSLNPSEAAESIVGKLTSVKGDAVSDTLQRMKHILGENSEAWQSVKREVLVKMLEKGSGTFERDIRTMMRSNPKLARELFTTGELRGMLQHGEVAKMVGPPREKGVANYSASGYEMLRNMVTNPLDLRFYFDAVRNTPKLVYRNVMKGDPLSTPGQMLSGKPDLLMPGAAYRGIAPELTKEQEPDTLALARRLMALPMPR